MRCRLYIVQLHLIHSDLSVPRMICEPAAPRSVVHVCMSLYVTVCELELLQLNSHMRSVISFCNDILLHCALGMLDLALSPLVPSRQQQIILFSMSQWYVGCSILLCHLEVPI